MELDDRKLREFLQSSIQTIIAKYLPAERKTLARLLSEEIPHVRCRDGSTHMFKRRELEELLNYVKPDELSRVKLPIIIEYSPQLGEGAAVVRGYEARIVARILGLDEPKEDKLVIYGAMIGALKSKFKTIFMYAFSNEYVQELIRMFRDI